MPRFRSTSGGSVVNVDDATAAGLGDEFVPYDEQDDAEQADESGPYDPSAHTVEEVLAYVEDLDDDERQEVLLAEESGKGRKGVLGGVE